MIFNMMFAAIGFLLLALGRKLFWFFVAAVGMAAGLALAQQQLLFQPYWVVLLAGLGAGIVGALLAIFFQQLAIVAAGLVAGAGIAAHMMMMMGVAVVPWICLCGGILGAILLHLLFDWALVVLSSIAGAALIVQSMMLSFLPPVLLFSLLGVAGIVFQLSFSGPQKTQVK
ncbi:MAG: hypothetical protein M0036_13420 [Desulfobacteraceae bacterium]|nr:hypothetical protein [Desulfobacteraceae bacterium]